MNGAIASPKRAPVRPGSFLERIVVPLAVLIAVFGSGACLMSLEMAGFRLVQPEYGGSIIVWGSLISVFLGGLAAGAYVGGRLADHRPALWKLGVVLLLAGGVALAMPLYSDPVLEGLFPGKGAPLPEEWETSGSTSGELQIYMGPDLRLPTLGVGMALFLVPSLLLGMVSPYAAKLLIHALGRLGAGVGKISGISTVGAILGTLGTAFYLIPKGTRWLLVMNGLVLAGLGVILALTELAARRRPADSP